jgi:hypothetical protein
MTDNRFSIVRTVAVLSAVVLTAAVAPSTSHAQTIDACYAPKTGTVYRTNTAGAPTQCSKGHTSFSWDAKSAVAGIATVSSGYLTVAAGEKLSHVLWCPAGKTPVQSGWEQYENSDFPGHGPIHLVQSWPSSSNGTPVGWIYKVQNPTSVPVMFSLILTCADVKLPS